MGWLIALGVSVLLAVTPVGIRLRYNSEGIFLQAVMGLVHITVLPKKKKSKDNKRAKDKKQPPDKEKKPAKKTGKSSAPSAKEQGGSVTDFLPLVKVGLDFLGEFRRKLRLDNLELKLILGGGDPDDLAVNYGKAWAAVGNLMPQLERIFVIRKRNIEVECDFMAEQTLVIARVQVTITVGRLLATLVRYGIRAMREYLKITNKRKGGALQ
jgi:hypothetical protein